MYNQGLLPFHLHDLLEAIFQLQAVMKINCQPSRYTIDPAFCELFWVIWLIVRYVKGMKLLD